MLHEVKLVVNAREDFSNRLRARLQHWQKEPLDEQRSVTYMWSGKSSVPILTCLPQIVPDAKELSNFQTILIE